MVSKRGGNERDDDLNVTSGHVACLYNGDDSAAGDGDAMKRDLHEVATDMKNSVRFIECRFHGNHAKSGGAVYSRDVDLYLEKCVFENNKVNMSGGAIYFESKNGNMLSINQSSFHRNIAGVDTVIHDASRKDMFSGDEGEEIKEAEMGGAVFARNPAAMRINASHFDENKGCRGGGAIAVFHGAIPQQDTNDAADFLITDSGFRENRGLCTEQPEALRFEAHNAHEDSLGGALRVESFKDALSMIWRIRNASFVDNHARGGGAVSFQSRIPSATPQEITLSTFDGNIALMNGGAIAVSGIHLTVNQSTIKNGKALAGSGIYAFRGSVLNFIGHPKSTPSVIEGNEAGRGGGIYTRDSAIRKPHSRP